MKPILSYFREPHILAVVGDQHTGKSNILYALIRGIQANYEASLYSFGMQRMAGVTSIHSLPELEKIRNSIIFVDELPTLFDLENRKQRKMIENSLRLIYHQNNVLVLSGLAENFKKFLSAKVHVWLFKQTTLADLVNGSKAKQVVMDFKGEERGSSMLMLEQDSVLVFNGLDYRQYKIPYVQDKDSKANNVQILCKKGDKNDQNNK